LPTGQLISRWGPDVIRYGTGLEKRGSRGTRRALYRKAAGVVDAEVSRAHKGSELKLFSRR